MEKHLVLTLMIAAILTTIIYAEEKIEEGSPAPHFLRRDLDNKMHRLDDYVGAGGIKDKTGKVLLLSFFATYCKPCLEKLPEIEKLDKQYRKAGLEIFYISAEPRSELSSFSKRERFPFTILYDSGGLMSTDYGVIAIPTYIIIDADGIVRLRSHDGSTKVLPKLQKTLAELLPRQNTK